MEAVIFKVRPKQSVRINQVVVRTDSWQKLRRERAERMAQEVWLGCRTEKQLRRVEVEMHVGPRL